jgi:hypothetical protein
MSPEFFVSPVPQLPYGLEVRHIQRTIEDLYEYLHTVNTTLVHTLGLDWQEHITRPATLSNFISDFVHVALGQRCPTITPNRRHNGHPDLVPVGMFPDDSAVSGEEGIEIKATRVTTADTHGARDGYICQFNYWVDPTTVVADRRPTHITKVFVARFTLDDFRRNERLTEIGTSTSALHKDGLAILRKGAVYLDPRFNKTNKPTKAFNKEIGGQIPLLDDTVVA